MRKQKDVFLLGAGFSKGAGAPLQSEILPEIKALDVSTLMGSEKEIFDSKRKEIFHFLSEHMYFDINNLPDLEDVYTPLDKCRINNYSYRDIAITDVNSLRSALDCLISIYMKKRLEDISGKNNFIEEFSNFIVDKKTKDRKNDFISIITTNWDIILDHSIQMALSKKPDSKGIIDYCCYTTPFYPTDRLMPGLLAKGAGYFNIKILKLHGSLNWLFCPRCGRIFTKIEEKIAINEYTEKPKCRICQKNYSVIDGHDGGAALVSQLLMPTYIKDIENTQIKLIWQNANIELSEAKRLIVIGYSFPVADFELRQLLSRNVPLDCEIIVVLKNEDPEIISRFKKFFGKRRMVFLSNGAESFIKEYIVDNKSKTS